MRNLSKNRIAPFVPFMIGITLFFVSLVTHLPIDTYAYVPNTPTEVEEVTEPEYPIGEDWDQMGLFVIPELNISVGVYYADPHFGGTEYAQAIVDADDAAAMLNPPKGVGKTPVICDHSSQEFAELHNCEVGMIAYLVNGSEIHRYVCSQVDVHAENIRSTVVDSSGIDVTTYEETSFVCYTCNTDDDSGHSVTVVPFVEVYSVQYPLSA